MTNIPVEVELKILAGKAITVMDDELHSLIHQGLVSYKDAISALESKGVELDKRFYPWLRDVENWATGEFNLDGPAKPEAKPEVLSEDAHTAVDLHDEAQHEVSGEFHGEIHGEVHDDNSEGAE